MGFQDYLIQLLFHTDQAVAMLSQEWGAWLYLLLFLIVFAETGLVVTPFLPGDSLLFALGAMTTVSDSGLSFETLSFLLFSAALLGDNVNYHFGKYLGPHVFMNKKSKLFNTKHLDNAHLFYEKHGSGAVVIARFVPIVRTFVPFVAGLGKMNYKRFLSFSVVGAVLWIQLFLWAGRIFGNIPSVKTNFHLVIFGVIALSVAPIFWGFIKSFLKSRQAREVR
jgi:membrane-associated protein